MLTTLSEKVSPQHTALVVVDIQNDTCHEDGFAASLGSGVAAKQAMIPRLERLVTGARQSSVHVVVVTHENGEGTDSEVMKERHRRLYGANARPVNLRGSWGAECYRIHPLPGDSRVVKHRYSAFYESGLDLILRSHGMKTLIVAGVSTDRCVEATAKDAFMRGYYVVVPEDCTASQTGEAKVNALRNIAFLAGVVVKSGDILDSWTERD